MPAGNCPGLSCCCSADPYRKRSITRAISPFLLGFGSASPLSLLPAGLSKAWHVVVLRTNVTGAAAIFSCARTADASLRLGGPLAIRRPVLRSANIARYPAPRFIGVPPQPDCRGREPVTARVETTRGPRRQVFVAGVVNGYSLVYKSSGPFHRIRETGLSRGALMHDDVTASRRGWSRAIQVVVLQITRAAVGITHMPAHQWDPCARPSTRGTKRPVAILRTQSPHPGQSSAW